MKTIYKYLLIILFSPWVNVWADEGLWLPKLDTLQWQKMKEAGLMISPEEIYSEAGNSLKDAVVLFGGGCSGVLVSDHGLLLTNHHCSIGAIEKCSTLENDYLTYGVWKKIGHELPVPGLTATILSKIEDVTNAVLAGVNESQSKEERNKIIQTNLARIREEVMAFHGGSATCKITPLYGGQTYHMHVYEVFTDIRLVGAPPYAIGKFGQVRDNWSWPRHTGDFAFFRIYADAENKPASYSPENTPYKPLRSVPLSLHNIEEDSFCMVLGFPSTTSQQLISAELSQRQDEWSAKNMLLEELILVLEKYMQQDKQFTMSNTALYAALQNEYKKESGIRDGLRLAEVVKHRKQVEDNLREIIKKDAGLTDRYGRLFEELEEVTRQRNEYLLPDTYYAYGVNMVKIWGQVRTLRSLLNRGDQAAVMNFIERMKTENTPVAMEADKEWMSILLELYKENVPEKYHFPSLSANASDIPSWVDHLYQQTALAYPDGIEKLRQNGFEELVSDPAIIVLDEIRRVLNDDVACCLPALTAELTGLYGEYDILRTSYFGESGIDLWPDANGTLRLSYGKVKGYTINETAYPWYTVFDGVIEKNNTGLPEYEIPEKLRLLYQEKDYGEFAEGDTLPVCFTSTCHTVGGNSGSPVFNGYGELIGLNFDRNREGAVSEFYYDEAFCRNIVVDSRYILFIVDRYAGADFLLDELIIRR